MYFVVPFTWLFGLIEKGLLLVPTSAVRDGKCKVGSIVPNKNFGLMMGITNGISNLSHFKDHWSPKLFSYQSILVLIYGTHTCMFTIVEISVGCYLKVKTIL